MESLFVVLVAAAEMQMDASGAPRFPAGVWVREIEGFGEVVIGSQPQSL